MKLNGQNLFKLTAISSALIFSGNAFAAGQFAGGTGVSISTDGSAKANSKEAIAIGNNSVADGKNTGLRSMLLGNLPNAQGGISIGENATSQENGIHIGNRTQKAGYGSRAGATIVGTNSNSGGLLSSVFGTGNDIQINNNVKALGLSNMQGTLSTVLGAHNTVNAKQEVFDGLADVAVGSANTIERANGAMILGVNNKITNSYVEPDLSTLDPLQILRGDFSSLGNAELGSVGVMGGGNTVDYGRLSTVNGVGNVLSGKNGDLAEQNQITGYKNTVTDSDGIIITGSHNTVANGKQNIIFGDNHKLTGNSQAENTRNIVMGYGNNTEWKNVSNTVALGSEQKISDGTKEAVLLGDKTEVKFSGAVALGSNAVADIDKGQRGYLADNDVDKDKNETWESTQAGVSIGSTDGKITRQLHNLAAGTKDTDAVNVAQLKRAKTEVTSLDKSISVEEESGADGQTVYKVGVNVDGKTIRTDDEGKLKVNTGHLTRAQDGQVKADDPTGLVTGEQVAATINQTEADFKANLATQVNMINTNINNISQTTNSQVNVINTRIDNLDKGVNQLKGELNNMNNRIGSMDKDLRAGIAGALASGNLAHATHPGKSMISVGVGNYRGQTAVAVGISHLSENGKVGTKLSLSTSRGDIGTAASVGYQW